MSTYYDSYETVEAPRRHKHRHHHRDRDRDDNRDLDPEPRYVETRETYARGPAPLVPDAPYSSRTTDLIRRPVREDSDLSVEEVRRDFPPPGAGAYVGSRSMVRDDRYGPPARSRSMERDQQYGQYLGDPRDDRRSRKKVVKEEILEPRRRSLSRNQKILAGVAGAALAVGGKELWDRRQNDGHAPEERNILATAAIGAAGAFAGYEGAEFAAKKFPLEKKKKESTYIAVQGRDGNVAEYYSTDSEHEKPKKSHSKHIIEGALGLAGIGAAAKAASGGHRDDDRSDRRSRRRSGSEESTRSRRRDKSRGGEGEGIAKIQQAAKAAILAGAAEAFRVRKEPGGWSGAKGKRILTAAIGAGGIDAAADRDPDHHSKRHILEAVVGGLAGNRILNGSRSGLEAGGRSGRGGRSRSRSRAPSSSGGLGGNAGLAALATAGIGALAGKKLLDRSRSRSRGGDDRDDRRSRRRAPSEDSFDDRKERRRSKSVSEVARKGLAALGIGTAAEAGRDERRRDRDRDVDEETHVTRKSRRSHGGDSDDDYDDRRDYASSRGDPYGDSRDSRDSRHGGGSESRRKDRGVAEGKDAHSDTDSLGSSSGDEKRVKKMKGKQLLTAGLATVATIHAAHNVYQSYEKREARRKAVESGKMSPEEAKKLKSKAILQDAASIGIAALGIKGAVSVSLPLSSLQFFQIQILTAFKEWKEMREMRHECLEFEEKKEERHKKRMERQKRIKGGPEDDEGGEGDESDAVATRPQHYGSAPDLTYGGRYQEPHYTDGNPYASGGLPAPPVGYAYQPRR
jgi:hypothetical protein